MKIETSARPTNMLIGFSYTHNAWFSDDPIRLLVVHLLFLTTSITWKRR